MINTISNIINAIQAPIIVHRSSTCAYFIVIDMVQGTCDVCYHNGNVYRYTNVSRRAMFKLLNDETVSLGFFINCHLLFCDSKCGGACELLPA